MESAIFIETGKGHPEIRNQWRIQGSPHPLLLDQTEARRAGKNFFETAPSLPPPPPPPHLSEGLDPPLDLYQQNSKQKLDIYSDRKQIS